MRQLLRWALLASILCPLSALADDRDPEDVKPVRAVVGFGSIAMRDKEVYLLRNRFHLGGEFSHETRLTISPFVRLYSTTIDLHEKDDLPLDLSLNLPWQPVAGGSIEYLLWRLPRFMLSIRGTFETPLAENEATLDEYIPHGTLKDAPIDIDTLRQHVTVRHMWRGASASLIATGVFGPFRPKVEVGYLLLDSSLAVDFDETASTLLKTAQVNPDRFYDDGVSTPYYAAGLDIELALGFAIRFAGTVIPTGEKLFIAAEFGVVVPIDVIEF